MEKKLTKINILVPARFNVFRNIEPFTALDLLCECEYSDGTKEFLTNPYIEVPHFDKEGEYNVKIYRDKDTKEVYAEYKVKYVNSIKDKDVEEIKKIIEKEEIDNSKKGYFEIKDNKNKSLFSYIKNKKENIIPIFISDQYKGDYKKFMEEWGDRFEEELIEEVKEEAKKQNIEIEFKEVK